MDLGDTAAVPAPDDPAPAPEPAPPARVESEPERLQRMGTESAVLSAQIKFAADYIGLASNSQNGVAPEIIVDFETSKVLRRYMPENQQPKLKFDETKDSHGILSSRGWSIMAKTAFETSVQEIRAREHFVNVKYPSILLEFETLVYQNKATCIEFPANSSPRSLSLWEREFLASKGFTIYPKKKVATGWSEDTADSYVVRTWPEAGSSSSSSVPSSLPPSVIAGLNRIVAM